MQCAYRSPSQNNNKSKKQKGSNGDGGLGHIPDQWLAVNGEVADRGLDDASDRGGNVNDPRKL